MDGILPISLMIRDRLPVGFPRLGYGEVIRRAQLAASSMRISAVRDSGGPETRALRRCLSSIFCVFRVAKKHCISR
jgi:hypothetical protein